MVLKVCFLSLNFNVVPGLPYTTLWMDIEKYAWSSNKEHNRAFILDLLHEARSLGKKAGIYTNYYMWEVCH